MPNLTTPSTRLVPTHDLARLGSVVDAWWRVVELRRSELPEFDRGPIDADELAHRLRA
jgi:hypothetical protein